MSTTLPRVHIHITPKSSEIETPVLYSVLHDYELSTGIRQEVRERNVPLPEVFPMEPSGFFPLDEAWQRLWFDINELSPRDWRALLQYQRAFTNQNGFDKPGDPRRDYINRRDLDAIDDRGKPALPKMELLLCGGATVTGHVKDGYLYVDTLDGNNPPPPAEWVIARPWYWFAAVSINPKGEIHNLTQGGMGLVKRVPIVSRYPVRFPLAGLRKL